MKAYVRALATRWWLKTENMWYDMNTPLTFDGIPILSKWFI